LKLENNHLVLENAGDMAQLLSIVKYYNNRWIPINNQHAPYILEIFPVSIVKELEAAWLEQTKKECQ